MFEFDKALQEIKSNKLLTRDSWGENCQYVFLVPGSKFKVNRPPLNVIFEEDTEIVYGAHIDIKTTDGHIEPWIPSQEDILANDWKIVNQSFIVWKIDQFLQ